MKRYIFFLMVILTSPVTVMAQGYYGSDSIVNFSQRHKINALALKSTALRDSSQKYYGVANLEHQFRTGSLRRAQGAYSTNTSSFYTEGYHTIGKFWIAGSFLFNKTVEDSLANALKRDDDDISPYYYFASKSGPYERQNYKLNALIDYSLIPEKLNIGTLINYETHWTTGSVDPRPSVEDFKLKLSPQLNYQVNNRNNIGLGIHWGYGYEETSISFKNREFLQSLAYPDRIHYINQGYGYISIKDSTSLRRFKDYSGIIASYQYRNNRFSAKVYGNYTQKVENNTHDVKSRKTYHVRERFTLDEFDIKVLLTKESDTYTQQLDVNALKRNGSDWNAAFKKSNYSAKDDSYHVNYSLLWNIGEPVKHQADIGFNYESSLREDAVSSHHLYAEGIQPEIKYTFYHQNANNDFWIASITGLYKKPLNTEVSVPATQVNVFSRGIMFPDYYYYSSNILGLKNELNYISSNLIKNYKIGFSLNTELYSKTNTATALYDAQFIPKGSRFSIVGRISIYL